MNENIQPQTASTVQGGIAQPAIKDCLTVVNQQMTSAPQAVSAVGELVSAVETLLGATLSPTEGFTDRLLRSSRSDSDRRTVLCVMRRIHEALLLVKECAAEEGRAEPKSDGWVSVNDRLPEEGKECIVFLKDLIPEVLNTDWSQVTVDEIQDGEWTLNNRESVVTHWQPLPEPPKKGDA